MSSFKELAPHDVEAQRHLTQLTLGKLSRMAAAMSRGNLVEDALAVPNNGNFYGICAFASSAMTIAAHELGYTAVRQLSGGGHCFTSFARVDARPSDDDLIGCMTPRQFDGARDSLGVDPNYPLGGAPFFGTRREIMGIVAGDAVAYAAPAVIFHQITHRPDPVNPELPHEWLMTTPDDLLTGRYQMGQVGGSDIADQPWYRAYPEL